MHVPQDRAVPHNFNRFVRTAREFQRHKPDGGDHPLVCLPYPDRFEENVQLQLLLIQECQPPPLAGAVFCILQEKV